MKRCSFFLSRVVFLTVFAFFPNLAHGLWWPVGPGDEQQQVTSTFGEFRPKSGNSPPYDTTHFHDGIDIYGYAGTPVYGVETLYVDTIWAISEVSKHVRTSYHDYFHINPEDNLQIGDTAWYYLKLGVTVAGHNHLHFTSEYDNDVYPHWGREYNPLLQSLGPDYTVQPFKDTHSPVIEYVKLVDHETQQEFPGDTITGYVDIIVKASDRTSYPGGVDYNNGVFEVRYVIHASGDPWNYNIRFDYWPWVHGWDIDCVYADSSSISDYCYIASNKMNSDTFWNTNHVYDGWWMIEIRVYDQDLNYDFYYLPVYVHNDLPYLYGDINLDGTPYETSDAVLFCRYFIYGLGVFSIDQDRQVAATDVNRDGRALMLADLIALIKVIQGDAPRIWGPFPKLPQSSHTVDFIAKMDGSKVTLSSNSDLSLSAALFVFEHNGLVDPPNLLCNDKMQLMWRDHKGELRILIWSLDGKVIPRGGTELFSFNCSGEIDLIWVEAVDSEIRELKANIIENDTKMYPSDFFLCQNYPNPFNPETEIRYSLPKDGKVKLVIYNMLGQRVKTLVDEYLTAGSKLAHWDGKDENGNQVASGIYFYEIQAGGFVQSKKMVLLR